MTIWSPEPRRRRPRAAAAYGTRGHRHCSKKSTMGRGGDDGGAHRDSNGAVVELGEGLGDADRRAKSGGRCGGDELGGIVTGCPAVLGLVERSRMS